MVIVAFRTGLCVTQMGEELENAGDSTASWTYVVPDATEEATQSILDAFHTINVGCCYVSLQLVLTSMLGLGQVGGTAGIH